MPLDSASRLNADDFGPGSGADPDFFLPPTSGTAGNGLPIYSYDQAAAQIVRNTPGWNLSYGQPLTITYAFRSSIPNGAELPGGAVGFVRFTDEQIAAAEQALRMWADTANITFVRVNDPGSNYSNNATILFYGYTSGASSAAAFAFTPPGGTGSGDLTGDVFVNTSLSYNAHPVEGDYGPQVYLHEIGHALGLHHPGDYNAGNGNPTYPDSATYYQDARMYTVMSYFGSSGTGGSLDAYSSGPQLHDIAAIQLLYGANTTTRNTDTTYGFNNNTGYAHFGIPSDPQFGPVFSIWDGGGNDTLDLSGYNTNSEIDLRPESFSSAGPGNSGVGIAVGNISIARGVIIENGIGGGGDDTIIGNDASNTLTGNGGNDTMSGGIGNDILNGGTGADTMIGGVGDDVYYVDNVSDVITENSGEGIDVALVSVSGYTLGANVEVAAIQNGAGIVLTGNSLSNILYGSSGADTLNGGDGDDTLQGGANSDTLVGGLGNDTYYVAQPGDVVNENSGEGFDATIVQMTNAYTLADNVEVGATFLGLGVNITGNGLDNLLYGGGGADTLNGAGGNDTIQGNAGNDTMIGGLGNDTYFFEDAGDVITENPGEGIDAVIVFTNSYTLAANVEVGARFLTTAYTLTGNELDNQLYGNNGNDTLNGGDGNDTIQGGGGNDTMVGGLGNDTYFVEQAGDIVTENPGEGSDAVIVLIDSYTLAANVEVGATFLTSGASITGNGLDNRLYGNIGADTLNGAGGADLLDGGAGADTLTGGSENDVFSFVAGQANGDTVTDFNGNGAGAGDQLWFAGYGTLAGGASFVQLDATHWQINSADGTIHDTITLSNSASIDSSDWLFV